MGLKIKNVQVYGLEESVMASGYPMKLGVPTSNTPSESDFKRMKRLGKVKVGSGHDTALRGVIVQFDMRYPEYLSPQLQRYHWIDIVSSQSKMHRITENVFTESDFGSSVPASTIGLLNVLRLQYINAKTTEEKNKWKQELIENLPMSYHKWMRVSTNYLQLKTIYFQRRHHFLKEWRDFCDWIETLPYFKEFINID